MKQDWLKKENVSNKLLIFFAGWSCESRQFENLLIFEGYDTLMISDYRSLEPINVELSQYSSVVVIGWSFGVYIASMVGSMFCNSKLKEEFMSKNSLNIAINGTTTPIDDQFGIPTKGFDITLASIRKGGITKFNSRISRGAEENFIATTKDIDSLYDELKSLFNLSKELNDSSLQWQYSIVSTNDLIFPPKNQCEFWKKKSIFAPILIDAPHFPFTGLCVDKIKELLKIDR